MEPIADVVATEDPTIEAKFVQAVTIVMAKVPGQASGLG